jgi:hypothetical protein
MDNILTIFDSYYFSNDLIRAAFIYQSLSQGTSTVDSTLTAKRSKNYLEVTDADGCRHYVKITSIQWLSDLDPCRTDTLLTAAGRTIHIPIELSVLRDLVDPTHGENGRTFNNERR